MGPDGPTEPRPSAPTPNHSTSVMAFGVKWNENGEEGEPSGRPSWQPRARGGPPRSPRRRAGPPSADAEAARRARRLHPPTLGPRQDGEGEEGEGRSRQPFSLPAPNTHTHTRSRDAGPRGARPRAPAARAPAQPGPGVGAAGKPPGAGCAAHTPPSLALLPAAKSSCCPGKARPSARPPPPPGRGGPSLTAQPGRLVVGGRTRGAGSATRSRGHTDPGASQAPGGGGDHDDWATKCVERDRGDSSGAGTPRSQRPPRSGGRRSAAAAGLVPSPQAGLCARTGSGRCVCPASPPPAPPPAAAAPLRPARRPRPRSGPARCAAARSSPLAPGADRAGR